MMKKHDSMWCDHLGEIKTTQHSMDLDKKSKIFSHAPYRADHYAGEIINEKVKKMLAADVTEPSNF